MTVWTAWETVNGEPYRLVEVRKKKKEVMRAAKEAGYNTDKLMFVAKTIGSSNFNFAIKHRLRTLETWIRVCIDSLKGEGYWKETDIKRAIPPLERAYNEASELIQQIKGSADYGRHRRKPDSGKKKYGQLLHASKRELARKVSS